MATPQTAHIRTQQWSSQPNLTPWEAFTDAAGAAINLSGVTLILNVYNRRTMENIFAIGTAGASGNKLTVSGASNNVVTIDYPQSVMETAGDFKYDLWTLAGSPATTALLLASGAWIIDQRFAEDA